MVLFVDETENDQLFIVTGVLADSDLDVVNAYGNVLVDDAVFNLDEWSMAGGVPIFFDNYGTNKDGWGVENKKYVRTRSLEILKKY